MKTLYGLAVVLVIFCINSSLSQTNYYVNPSRGNNHWDGLSPAYTLGTHGPKATIQAAVNAASALDTVNLVEHCYGESVTISKSLVICCPGSSSVRNLTVRNNSQTTLDGNLEIAGTLTLDSGVIVTDPDCSIAVTNSSACAVQITGGSIKGTITRTVELYSTQSYAFTDANTQITLGGTNAPGGIECTAQVSVTSAQGQQPPSFSAGPAINRYYQITADPAIAATLRLAYFESELNGIVEANLVAFHWNENSWVQSGGSLNPINNYVELTNVALDGLSKWTLGDPSHPLPIQLAGFNAIVSNGHDVQLSWRTLTETNNYGFYIQQRTIPGEFADVSGSFIPGHGTTIEPHDYSWTHSGVAPGSYDYRLRQIDLDGSSHFSDSREVIISSLSGVAGSLAPTTFNLAQNFPNPFNPSTQIQFSVDRTGYTTLAVFDVLGKEVGTIFSGTAEPGRTYSVNFDASRMTNGTYLYKLVNGSQTSLKKMMLLK